MSHAERVVRPSAAGLSVDEPLICGHTKAAGKRCDPFRIGGRLHRSESRHKQTRPGRVQRGPIEVPLGADDEIAHLIVEAERAAADETALARSDATAKAVGN